MPEFGGRLDSWLEAPYVDAARWQAEFEAWCERTGTDFDDPDAEAAFEDALEDEYADVPEPPDDDVHEWGYFPGEG